MTPLLPSPGFRSPLVGGGLALFLLFLGAPPMSADWIVLRDGKMLQTDGPWAVKGERLIFTSTEGHRRALPLAEIDLESSHEASGTKAGGRKLSPRSESDEKDVARSADNSEASLAALASTLNGPDPRAVTNVGGSLIVTERRDELSGGALHLTGKLHNRGRDQARNVSLIATLHDDEGEILGFKKAQLSSRTLGPDQKTNFRATFPGVTAYSRVTFEGTVPPPEPEVTEEMVAEAIARAKADAERREKERRIKELQEEERQEQLRAESARQEQQKAARRAEAQAAQASAKATQRSANETSRSADAEPTSPSVAEQQPPETASSQSSAGTDSTRLVGVRTDRLQTGTVVTVEANRTLDEASISQFRLENPPRLVLRISDVTEPYDVAAVRSPEIVQVRTGLHSTAERGDEIHLVFELASPDVESSVSTRGGHVLVKLEQR